MLLWVFQPKLSVSFDLSIGIVRNLELPSTSNNVDFSFLRVLGMYQVGNSSTEQ